MTNAKIRGWADLCTAILLSGPTRALLVYLPSALGIFPRVGIDAQFFLAAILKSAIALPPVYALAKTRVKRALLGGLAVGIVAAIFQIVKGKDIFSTQELFFIALFSIPYWACSSGLAVWLSSLIFKSEEVRS